MALTLLDIRHIDFFGTLDQFIAKMHSALETPEHTSVETVDEIISKAKVFIDNHLHHLPEQLTNILDGYYDAGYESHFRHIFMEEGNSNSEHTLKLGAFLKRLVRFKAYLSVVDTLVGTIAPRHVKSATEKNEFILSKLNILFGEDFYSISTLLSLNDIDFRNGETREIAEDLSRRGYVILRELYRQEDDSVKISVKGATYIERKNKQKNKTSLSADLNQRLDDVVEHLTKLGFGQEIIFNEIQELRELQTKLSKKSWSQLLKGKLFDLAIDNIIDTEIASSLYEYLTQTALKLLK